MSKFEIKFINLSRIYRKLNPPDIVMVDCNSTLLLRKALQQCARYFQREGYSDWLHYDLNESNFVGFLFMDRNYCHAVGGCLFRLRKFADINKPFFSMHWIWLHPYVRNKGLLSKHVDYFNQIFGYWYPEYPLSKAMQAFVEKHKLIAPEKKFSESFLPCQPQL